ncbi:MAG: hypothetical protein ABMA01_23345 [Chthoniobacteraceae bacterium]
MNPTLVPADATFERLLDESAALLHEPHLGALAFPDDELHREILLPLLPALLGDKAIRKHWQERTATGFLTRLKRHLQAGEAEPRWEADDFEIHVTASYAAGPDAKALADTLLSEDSLREMAAGLMNQILEAVRVALPSPAIEVVTAAAEIPEAAVVEPVLEAAPVTEPPVAPAAPRAAFVLPPLPAAMFAHRLRRKAVRSGRENPISGTRSWRGKIGEPDWSRGYPIAGCTAEP